MKKTLLAGLCLAALAVPASALTKTDVIDVDALTVAAAMDGKSLANFDDGFGKSFFDVDGSLTESGASYKLGYVSEDNDKIYFLYDGFLATTSNPAGLNLKEIRLYYEGAAAFGSSAWARETAVEYHASGDFQLPNVGYDYSTYTKYPGNTDMELTRTESVGSYKPEGSFQHFVLKPQYSSMESQMPLLKIEVEWTDEVIVPQVKTPEIMAQTDATGAYPSPVNVSVRCSTEGVTGEYTWTKNGNAGGNGTLTWENNWSNPSFAVEGVAGDEIHVTVVCKKENWLDSEAAELDFTITLPGLRKPEGDLWGWQMFKPFVGRSYKIYNNNQAGTLYYKVNGVQASTTEQTLVLTVAGQTGDEYNVEAWVEADGYQTSEVATYEGTIADSKLCTPEFSIADGAEVRPGTALVLYVPEYDDKMACKSIQVRINDGEWTEVDKWSDWRYAVEEPVTVEAQLIAWTEPEDEWTDNSYRTDSDIATVHVALEVIADHLVDVNPYIFPADNDGSQYFYPNDTNPTVSGTANGYEFELSTFMQHEYDWQTQSLKEPKFYINHAQKGIVSKTPLAQGLSKFRVDKHESTSEWGADMVLYTSNEPIDLTNLGENVTRYEFNVHSQGNEWIELPTSEARASAKYVALSIQEGNNYPNFYRLLLEPRNTTAVETIDADRNVTVYYDLNGMRVSADRLGAGIYVKVTDGKASKVLVK